VQSGFSKGDRSRVRAGESTNRKCFGQKRATNWQALEVISRRFGSQSFAGASVTGLFIQGLRYRLDQECAEEVFGANNCESHCFAAALCLLAIDTA